MDSGRHPKSIGTECLEMSAGGVTDIPHHYLSQEVIVLKYESIETLFVRDNTTNKLDWGNLRNQAWQAVGIWHLTEKIDGTNIRVIVNKAGVEVRGRTDNAQVSGDLVQTLRSLFIHQEVMDYFKAGKPGELADDWCVTFYGEGYGPGIKGSEPMAYRPKGKHFRCFDICYGEKQWADFNTWKVTCEDLEIDMAPILGTARLPMSFESAENMMIGAGHSRVAHNENATGDILRLEGVVARPSYPLFDVYGNRMVWKLCWRELDNK